MLGFLAIMAAGAAATAYVGDAVFSTSDDVDLDEVPTQDEAYGGGDMLDLIFEEDADDALVEAAEVDPLVLEEGSLFTPQSICGGLVKDLMAEFAGDDARPMDEWFDGLGDADLAELDAAYAEDAPGRDADPAAIDFAALREGLLDAFDTADTESPFKDWLGALSSTALDALQAAGEHVLDGANGAEAPLDIAASATAEGLSPGDAFLDGLSDDAYAVLETQYGGDGIERISEMSQDALQAFIAERMVA
ncbi:MAG: hypothetical protein ACU0DW_08080 [Shimia sp.]